MSDAADRLARSRSAIIEQVGHRGRDRREQQRHAEGVSAASESSQSQEQAGGWRPGWFSGAKHAFKTWWRYHPAHMAIDFATPALSEFARRKPAYLLGIAAAAGALAVVARPWRLISVTGLLLAVVKSSQLSGLVMSALSAANYQKDDQRSG